MTRSVLGSSLALAVAGIVAAASANPAIAAHHETAKVKCSGINSCKGTSECATATTSCKGKNECKGKGWVHADSAKACTDKGGTVVTDKK